MMSTMPLFKIRHGHPYVLIAVQWAAFKQKIPDGTVSRYKARLVARGFHQHAGLYFFQIFSTVVKPTTLRVILTVALAKGWSIHQLDISNVFLNGFLKKDIYLEQPPGFQKQVFLPGLQIT